MVKTGMRGKITAFVLTAVVITVVVYGVFATVNIARIVDEQTGSRVGYALKTAKAFYEDNFGGPWQIRDGELYCGKHRVSGDMASVDKIAAMTGVGVSVFQGDTRVATSLVNAEGKRVLGTKVAEQVYATTVGRGEEYRGEALAAGVPMLTAYVPVVNDRNERIGIIGVGLSLADVAAVKRANYMAMLIGGAVIIVAVVLFSFWFCRRLTGPIASTREVLVEMSKGNFAVGLPAAVFGRHDEVGDMARALNQLKTKLRDVFQRIIMAADQVSSASEGLSNASQEAAQASNQVAEAVTDIAGGIDRQSAAMSETSSIVEESSASLEEVAATANHVSASSAKMVEDANEGGKAAETAVRQMGNIQTAVNELAKVIDKLGNQSQSIGQIVNTIASIAAQTNLLALNAAIEAARAGEQGRGFAVVAEEVRKLAEQSQEAAKQISNLIVEIQSDTEKAVVAMNNGEQEVRTGSEVVNAAGEKFRLIAEAVAEVNGQMREISAAVEEMAAGSQRMVHAIRETDSVSKNIAQQAQTVSAATEETSASMEEIASSSRSLAGIAAEMQETVTSFAGTLLMSGAKQTEGQLRLTDDLKTGVSAMDGQHSKLIDYINELYHALQKAKRAGRADESLKKLVRDVASYADEHLADEEGLMRKYGYPAFDEQYKAHEYYRQRVRAALAQLNNSPIESAESVYRFLNGWLVAHIANMDTQYGSFFHSKGVR
ncbi:MAG: bacteriohemerythrin [Negativicutes bacterium]|nr:bacteriohemerythrin [Negativicutes bacterium]